MGLLTRLRALVRRCAPEAIPAIGAQIYAALPGRFTRAAQERIAERVRIAGGVIVDIGCGPGALTTALARGNPEALVIAVDLSAPMLAQARRRMSSRLRAALVQANAARLPFADGSADIVISVGSLHHWRDPVGGINEIHRCLRPGGVVWIFDGYPDAAAEDMSGAVPGLRLAVARRIARAVMSVHGFRKEEYDTQVRTWFGRSLFGGCHMEPDLIWMRVEARKEDG
jgi:ubiquinone/menaquinone biosynthesis C-methylase UbiE